MSKKKVDWLKDAEREREEIREKLKKKDYVLTVYTTGDPLMSSGDYERQCVPDRSWTPCSLEEIPDYIKKMQTGFWTHPDLRKGSGVKPEDIPHKEKQWGIYYNIIIEPMSEELEKSYLDASEKGFFKSWRTISEEERLRND
jgi:hypothetical protein